MAYCPVSRSLDVSHLTGLHDGRVPVNVTFFPPLPTATGNTDAAAESFLFPIFQPHTVTAALSPPKTQTSMGPSVPSKHADNSLTRYVCTVQQFQNLLTGPLMYLFVQYYLQLGWHVLVYDQFGRHQSFLSDLLGHPRLDYFPYTVFELLFPEQFRAMAVEDKVRERLTPALMIDWLIG
jgi:hypothetical protein